MTGPITGFAAILVYLLVGLALAAIFIGVSVFLGPKKPNEAKRMPYESGMTPTGDTHQRFGVHYYLVAMLYIIFDVELIFMYPWAVLLRRELGRFGLLEMGIFMVVLFVGYIYVVKKGALEWD